MSESQPLAQLVHRRRQQLGMSLRDLEGLSEISRGRLSQIESGQRRPGVRVLQKLAGPLQLSLRDLTIAAGFPAPELPSLQPYLRAAYGFTPEAAADVERYLRDRYGVSGAPSNGEDELPDIPTEH